MPELPDLDTMLRDAADDASRRALVSPYDLIASRARSRRTARVAAAGAFGVVLCLAIGVAAVAGTGKDGAPDSPGPAASATATAIPLDPSLRQYWTRIPILTWTPDAGREASDVARAMDVHRAVFSALGGGDQDASHIDDLRRRFPDAPVGGPALAFDQSVTKAQLERAAANVRKVDGVQDARVVEVDGLWFTMSATGPASGSSEPPVINLDGIPIGGSASGQDRNAQNEWVNWVRASYVGPAIDRATFDLLRERVAEAVRIDVSQVVVTAESA